MEINTAAPGNVIGLLNFKLRRTSVPGFNQCVTLAQGCITADSISVSVKDFEFLGTLSVLYNFSHFHIVIRVLVIGKRKEDKIQVSGMLCLVDLQMFADVAVERVAFIFRIRQSENCVACPLRWKHCSLPKGR